MQLNDAYFKVLRIIGDNPHKFFLGSTDSITGELFSIYDTFENHIKVVEPYIGKGLIKKGLVDKVNLDDFMVRRKDNLQLYTISKEGYKVLKYHIETNWEE